jgi:hypothetical protein
VKQFKLTCDQILAVTKFYLRNIPGMVQDFILLCMQCACLRLVIMDSLKVSSVLRDGFKNESTDTTKIGRKVAFEMSTIPGLGNEHNLSNQRDTDNGSISITQTSFNPIVEEGTSSDVIDLNESRRPLSKRNSYPFGISSNEIHSSSDYNEDFFECVYPVEEVFVSSTSGESPAVAKRKIRRPTFVSSKKREAQPEQVPDSQIFMADCLYLSDIIFGVVVNDRYLLFELFNFQGHSGVKAKIFFIWSTVLLGEKWRFRLVLCLILCWFYLSYATIIFENRSLDSATISLQALLVLLLVLKLFRLNTLRLEKTCVYSLFPRNILRFLPQLCNEWISKIFSDSTTSNIGDSGQPSTTGFREIKALTVINCFLIALFAFNPSEKWHSILKASVLLVSFFFSVTLCFPYLYYKDFRGGYWIIVSFSFLSALLSLLLTTVCDQKTSFIVNLSVKSHRMTNQLIQRSSTSWRHPCFRHFIKEANNDMKVTDTLRSDEQHAWNDNSQPLYKLTTQGKNEIRNDLKKLIVNSFSHLDDLTGSVHLSVAILIVLMISLLINISRDEVGVNIFCQVYAGMVLPPLMLETFIVCHYNNRLEAFERKLSISLENVKIKFLGIFVFKEFLVLSTASSIIAQALKFAGI